MSEKSRNRASKARSAKTADRISRPRFVESKIICRHFVRFHGDGGGSGGVSGRQLLSGAAGEETTPRRPPARSASSKLLFYSHCFSRKHTSSARHKSNSYGRVRPRKTCSVISVPPPVPLGESASPQKTISTRHLTQFAGPKVRPRRGGHSQPAPAPCNMHEAPLESPRGRERNEKGEEGAEL